MCRGDLYLSWERGRDTFDRLLIDGDHFINNGNWQWLSCSAFFSQFFRVTSAAQDFSLPSPLFACSFL